jgi:hypothetical protein
MRRYRVEITTWGFRSAYGVTVEAENANDAAITGLLRLGLVSLELVTGIDIRPL